MEVVAINDTADVSSLAHLLKYDSIHRQFTADVEISGQNILIDGRIVSLTHESQLENISWKDCDVVIESTGKFLTKLDLEKHLKAGAKKVILAASPEGDDVKMVVLGVNDYKLNESDSIVSNASCTTNCAAPMVQIIDENFGVDQAYITTIHSYTKDQSLHDSPHKDLRRARAGALSIIPTTTGAAKAITKIFPHLEIGGCGMRVPVANGSLTDITFTVQNECTIEEVNQLFYKASIEKYQRIVDYTEDPIVSADIVGNSASCLFDSQLTSVLGNMVKIVAWYDNEIGYSNRLADLIQRVAS
ncbi:MAG: glyceraldehyde 3-phosphate dehydrogenase NAD-binding domain-containing protein, partial [Flavobacteriales bacterium]|nr:glyceraldehyde 3-phosphate dehydrogenase NAD-binding domain-containing protein [Flavobacteriales bacterium]